MIKFVEGDLLEAEEDIIGHQVNCQGVMGSGVAKQIKDRFPVAYNEYKKSFKYTMKKFLLGRCQIIITDKYIANLFGQFDYGYGKQQTDYDALKNALMELKWYAKENELTVALPFKIGSDRGGADWNIVYGIIEEVFRDYKITLYKIQ